MWKKKITQKQKGLARLFFFFTSTPYFFRASMTFPPSQSIKMPELIPVKTTCKREEKKRNKQLTWNEEKKKEVEGSVQSRIRGAKGPEFEKTFVCVAGLICFVLFCLGFFFGSGVSRQFFLVRHVIAARVAHFCDAKMRNSHFGVFQ